MDISIVILWLLFAAVTFVADGMIGHFAANALFIWKRFNKHANYRRDYAPSFRSNVLYAWLAAGALFVAVSGLAACGENIPQTSQALALWLRGIILLSFFGLRLRALNKGARWTKWG